MTHLFCALGLLLYLHWQITSWITHCYLFTSRLCKIQPGTISYEQLLYSVTLTVSNQKFAKVFIPITGLPWTIWRSKKPPYWKPTPNFLNTLSFPMEKRRKICIDVLWPIPREGIPSLFLVLCRPNVYPF